jgi:hypothetical protein
VSRSREGKRDCPPHALIFLDGEAGPAAILRGMIRRLLGLTLFAHTLLMQLLVAHAHADHSPFEGSSRPHVHLSSLPLVALTFDHPSHPPHQQEGEERHASCQADDSCPEHDHDADAVYLPSEPVAFAPKTLRPLCGSIFGIDATPLPALPSFSLEPPVMALPPPPPEPGGVPVHLRASKLLI